MEPNDIIFGVIKCYCKNAFNSSSNVEQLGNLDDDDDFSIFLSSLSEKMKCTGS